MYVPFDEVNVKESAPTKSANGVYVQTLSSIVKSPWTVLSTTECVKGKLLGSSPVSVIVAVEFTGIEIDCDVDVGMLEETFKVIVPNGLYFVPLKTLKVKKYLELSKP